jgi:hypothetical protein
MYWPDMISSWMKKIVTWTFSQIEYGRRKGIGLLEFALYTMTRGQGVSHYTTRNSAGKICSSERKGYAASTTYQL